MHSPLQKQLEESLVPKEEELDPPLILVSATHWTIFASLGILLCALFFWAYFSTLAIRVSGQGVVFNPHTLININAPREGMVNHIAVFLSEKIETNTTIATINDQQVLSPASGDIVSIETQLGEKVTPTQVLVWLQPFLKEHEKQQVTGFLQNPQAEQVTVGMPVEITMADADPTEYGRLIGKVAELIPFWTSQAQALFPTKNFIDTSTPLFTHLIIVDLQTDPHTKSGYHWTSGKGPPFTIKPGTPCTLSIITEQKKLLSYLIP